jgi:hypothetical protein
MNKISLDCAIESFPLITAIFNQDHDIWDFLVDEITVEEMGRNIVGLACTCAMMIMHESLEREEEPETTLRRWAEIINDFRAEMDKE